MGKEWFLISHADKSIKEREKIYFCKRDKLPKWTSCSPGFQSKGELEAFSRIPDWKCSKCGGDVSLSYTNSKFLIAKKMCYECAHWSGLMERMKINKKIVVINGIVYTIVPDRPNTYFQGHGGRHFKIEILETGELIDTRNLWCGGEIPTLWEIKDTAKFLPVKYK